MRDPPISAALAVLSCMGVMHQCLGIMHQRVTLFCGAGCSLLYGYYAPMSGYYASVSAIRNQHREMGVWIIPSNQNLVTPRPEAAQSLLVVPMTI